MAKAVLDTVRFGRIEVDAGELVEFRRGLIGFEHLRRFLVLDGPAGTPLKWLQSAEDGRLAFIIADPAEILPEYVLRVKAADIEPIELTEPTDAALAVILTVPGDLAKATANLLGPIVFNVQKRLGVQVVAEGDHPVRHPVFGRREG